MRIGKVEISSGYMGTDDFHETFAKLKMFVIRTTYDQMKGCFIVHGVSQFFDEFPSELPAPVYEITVSRENKTSEPEVTVSRRKQ